jgi:hypothetical protein
MAEPPFADSTSESEPPPVEWPVGRRLRYCGGMSLLCATLFAILELVFGDVAGGQSRNFYSPTGWSPLGPTLRAMSFALVGGGLTLGLTLPLFRRRYGGALVGIFVYVAFVLGLELGWGGSSPHFPTGTFERWQLATLLIGGGAMFALLAVQMRPMALGEPVDVTTLNEPWSF